ncbi:MAG: NUDIX domain-containing protein [Bacteroidales bacterium]|nr:NUDIX domain-containing protein [Bacteroidales bacterium]
MQKYKVFINERWIFFGEFIENQFVENEEYDVLNISNQLIFNFAEMIKSGSFTRNIVLHQRGNVKESFTEFLNQFLVLEAAGGLVQNSKNAFLMIKRFGVWDFPKGKIEKRESIKEAALREVQEETAVANLSIVRKLPTTFHIYRYGNQWIVKRTYWFLMKSDFTDRLKPQQEEDILEAVWVPKKDLTNHLADSYGTLKELVKESKLEE